MHGTAFTTDLVLKVVDRVKNVVGMVDSSMNWEFQVEVLPLARKIRKDFLMLAGSEHMVSLYAIGGSGAFSAMSSIAPKLICELNAICVKGDYAAAQQAQFTVSKLYSLMKPWPASSLKAVTAKLGRDVGPTRPPVMPLSEEAQSELCGMLFNKRRSWPASLKAGLEAGRGRHGIDNKC